MSSSCKICGKYFSKPALLKRHQVVHTKEKLFNCENCSCCFSQKSSLKRHQLRKHANISATESKEVEQENGEEVAQQALAALINLQNHVETVQQAYSATLEEPPMVSRLVDIKDSLHPKSSDGSKVVLLRTQLIQRSLGGNRCYYVCEFCAKEFSKTYDLIRHRRVHTKEKPYACTRKDCFKRFATQSKLREHQKVLQCSDHSKAKKVPQPKTDQTLMELKRLLPQPLQNKSSLSGSFKCVYCQKVFTRKFNCRIHMLTHLKRLLNSSPTLEATTGFLYCSQCDKSFKKSHDLRRHLLIHSEIKSYSCHLCQKAFTLKSTLSRHVLTHQSDRISFSCQVCGKSFKAQTSLTLHLRLHTGERPFTCEFCEETFRTSGHRLEHMRSERHKIQKIGL